MLVHEPTSRSQHPCAGVPESGPYEVIRVPRIPLWPIFNQSGGQACRSFRQTEGRSTRKVSWFVGWLMGGSVVGYCFWLLPADCCLPLVACDWLIGWKVNGWVNWSLRVACYLLVVSYFSCCLLLAACHLLLSCVVVCFVGWLVGWLVSRLFCWMVGWLVV